MIDTAIILAGGLGTRLQPLTDETPKPLLSMLGKPIVQHIMENLAKYGIKKVILSIGYKAKHIQNYFGDGSQYGISLAYSLEQEPLGTGGAIKQAAKQLTTPFFLVWGDNLMDINYQDLYQTYLHTRKNVTMTITPREDVEHFGVAKVEQNIITSFVEKPSREQAPSNLINAGAFIIDPSCLSLLPEGKSSIEKDCFEKFAPANEIAAYIHHGQWFPTDTLEKYQIACLNFKPDFNLHEKKVIIADVDETICESCQQISEEMAEQINKMIKQGYTFAFISGTPKEELLRMVSSRLTETHHLLAALGTNYVHIENNLLQEQYNHLLSPQEIGEIIAACNLLIKTYDLQPLTSPEDQLQDRHSQITLSVLGRHAPHDMKKAFDPSGEKRKVWIEFLQQHLNNKYDIAFGGTTSIDITQKGMNKDRGIRTFAQHNNIPFSTMVYIGDKIYFGGNDYEASKVIDCIAVRNPQDTLQKLKQLSDEKEQ